MFIGTYTFIHGLIYGLAVTGYLFFSMVTLSPRIWGYQDYPERVKLKVPPQTRRERIMAGVIGIPFIVFTLGFPIYSVLTLKRQLGIISFVDAFVHLLVLVVTSTIGDLVVLDWLIISKITPGFVIIPGSEAEDYKDFSHHYRSHLRATIILILICAVLAAIITN